MSEVRALRAVDWEKSFECADRSGAAAQCVEHRHPDKRVHPQVTDPNGWPTWCPAARLTQCTPFLDWQRREIARRRDEWLPKSGIPSRYHFVRLGDSRPCPAVATMRAYYSKDLGLGSAITLVGPTDRGKTHAAIATLIEAAPRTLGQFFSVPTLARRLLYFDEQATLMEEVSTCALVVLDDLGSEYVREGGMVESLIDEILVAREADVLATIITSNMLPGQLRKRYGDRIARRLTGSWGRVVAITSGPEAAP